jgi:hypothetical protein
MYEVKLKDPFVSLPTLGNETLVPFSLFTLAYEQYTARRNGGIDLSSREAIMGITAAEEDHYRRLVPHFVAFPERRPIVTLESMVKRYKDITGPCSMVVRDLEELSEHILIAYQIAYANYILGIKDDSMKDFPSGRCGVSARNVMFSQMEIGYANAATASSDSSEHAYPILPFVMKDTGLQGVIIIDPTSDQLWASLEKKPRNMISVMLGDEWNYITEGGLDSFPKDFLYLGNLMENLHAFAPDGCFRFYEGGRRYLGEAFSNPIDLAISGQDQGEIRVPAFFNPTPKKKPQK